MGFYLAILAGTIAAASPCADYTGTAISYTTFDEVAEILAKMPVEKSEYETTEAYKQRLAQAEEGLATTYIVRYETDSDYLKYNADLQSLMVWSYALRNENTSYDIVFGRGTPLHGKIRVDTISNKEIVLSVKEQVIDYYEATNAFGAAVEVIVLSRKTQAIWDRAGPRGPSIFVANFRRGEDPIIGRISMSPDEARELKANNGAAVVFSPKWPYYAAGNRKFQPTIRHPVETRSELNVIVADIHCVLLLNGTDTAIASYALY